MGVNFGITMRAEIDPSKLQKEVEKELSVQIYGKTVVPVSQGVFAEMRDALEEHIKSDVYAEWEPSKYLRRSEHTGMGTSLLESAENAQAIYKKDGYKWTSGLRYEPTAEHDNPEWSDPDMEPDRLIGRIEKKIPPYIYEPIRGEIPKRPFWQNFVTEMIEGGRLARTVETILKEKGIAEPGDSIRDVLREESDGNY